MKDQLTICEDKNKEFYIKNATEETVSSIKEIAEKIHKGEINRHYGQTFYNHSSSRSHTIFRVNIKTITNNFIRNYKKGEENNNINGDEENVNNVEVLSFVDKISKEDLKNGSILTESVVNFVDLAGSEKLLQYNSMVGEENFEIDEKKNNQK